MKRTAWFGLAASCLVLRVVSGVAFGQGGCDREVQGAMEVFTGAGEIAGAVTVVADDKGIRHFGVTGEADLERNILMRPDHLFWVASMTKPVTGTAVMMMQEAGKLSVDDEVAKHLPEFSELKDGQGKAVKVTIKQLLTHTAGLSELNAKETVTVKSLAELAKVVARKPVQFEPGSRWQYSQTAINTAARIVEVVSGEAFPDFLESRIFKPLGMGDTTFYPSETQAKRLAKSYRRTDEGKLEAVPLPFLRNKPVTSKDRCPLANGGLFSTAADYTRFCRMILRGGELDGKRILRPESVSLMTTVQSGELETGFTPGNGWGLGWCVVRAPQGVSEALSPGSFGHGGAFGTQAWIDPVKKRVLLLMVQRANFPNSDASDVRRTFQKIATRGDSN